MNRRQAIKWVGAGAAVAAAAGGIRYRLLSPSPSSTLQSVDQLTALLFDSFDAETRKRACVSYDHPFRQYHNRGVGGGGILGLKLAHDQRSLLTDLLYAGLSDTGRERIPKEALINWPGVHAMNVLICGDPHAKPYQLLLTGPHINLRLGGKSIEGVAFGGPQVYGDQRGNEKQGLPGNLYRYQFQIAHHLFQSLSERHKTRAVQTASPIQTQVELQGPEGSFAGVPVAELDSENRTIARELVAGILSTYGPGDVEYAWQCLEHNGGVEALNLAYYKEGEVDGSGEYQIFRLEGPAAVFYFRGYPHVHAFINLAMNGDAPLSVGEALGNNPMPVRGAQVKQLFERALCAQAGCDHAFYPMQSVVGALRSGTIRSGDIYNLESWQERIAVIEIKGSNIRAPLDFKPEPQRTYTFATTGYGAEVIGRESSREKGIFLRDATIDYVRKHGFS